MKNSRRSFIKKSALGITGMTLGGLGMSAKSYSQIIGANDRINVALVGLGRRLAQGGIIEPIAMKDNNTNLKYFCDVMESQRTKAAAKYSAALGYTPRLENDVRRIHDDKEVDAVVLLTPDHWHAPGACYALQAGKHVYIEKPTSHNPREGAVLIEFQKKYGKLIQAGNQGSSSPKMNEMIKEIHNGIIGHTYEAIAFFSSRRGEVPVPKKAPVPDGLDWDLWQGPAPRQAYMHDTWDYNWHWYGWTWGTGEVGNNGIHRMDFARRALQVGYPEKVEVAGGKYHFKDDGWTMYDTLDVTLTFPGNRIIKVDSKSRNGHLTYGMGSGTVVYGTEGTVLLTGTGYKHYDRLGKLLKEDDSKEDSSTLHFTNFFSSIRGKEKLNAPVAEVEITTSWCHLANISYRTGRGFKVNTDNGKPLDKDAMKFWGREYEPGWEPKL